MPDERINQSSYSHSEPIFLPESYQMPKGFDVSAADDQSLARPMSSYEMGEYILLHDQQSAQHIVTTVWKSGWGTNDAVVVNYYTLPENLSLPILHASEKIFRPTKKISWGKYTAKDDYKFDREQEALVFKMAYSVSDDYMFLNFVVYVLVFVLWVVSVWFITRLYRPFIMKYRQLKTEQYQVPLEKTEERNHNRS